MSEEPIKQEAAVEMEVTKYEQSTACDHSMEWEDGETAVCANGCGHGCWAPRSSFEIVDGKLVPLGNVV